ncbi:MAG TPA: glycosyltransferase family 4 protein [Candidatus Stackebrandtia faecavium]|nr:glycosyltransferase family 4 protein [Candidatus Stackebrandtia faecavium]
MRIGMVCPYSFAVPGGVQGHVKDLSDKLLALGHDVSVLAPAGPDDDLPEHVVAAGRSFPVRYNGSVARLAFGPGVAWRVRRWLQQGDFDVVHVHEPLTPSLSLLACVTSNKPVVATFHTAIPRSRTLAAGRGMAQLVLERITARIAVSSLARRVQVEHLGGGAVEIPNGVAVQQYAMGPTLPRPAKGQILGFVGRFDEPRKGFPTLLEAFTQVLRTRPETQLWVLGPGDEAAAIADVSETVRDRIRFFGMADDNTKAAMLRTVDVYVAPNTGGESFGMILTEAMAAGTAVLASDLDAFRRVLDGGRAGILFGTGDPQSLADKTQLLLSDAGLREQYAQKGRNTVDSYDWDKISRRVVEVYLAAVAADGAPTAVTQAGAPVETAVPSARNVG